MIANAVAAFVGCFAALVALAGFWGPAAPAAGAPNWYSSNWLLRYIGGFLVGILLTAVLAWFLQWVAGVFAHIGG